MCNRFLKSEDLGQIKGHMEGLPRRVCMQVCFTLFRDKIFSPRRRRKVIRSAGRKKAGSTTGIYYVSLPCRRSAHNKKHAFIRGQFSRLDQQKEINHKKACSLKKKHLHWERGVDETRGEFFSLLLVAKVFLTIAAGLGNIVHFSTHFSPKQSHRCPKS